MTTGLVTTGLDVSQTPPCGRAVARRVVTLLAVVGAMAAPASGAGANDIHSGELLALTYNVAGLPELISGEEPSTNSPLISPLLNDYDLVLLQESWEDPHEVFEDLPILHYHHEIVAQADHPYQSEPAPNPFGTDPRQLPSAGDGPSDVLNRMGPALVSDGLNRLSRFPFGPLERVMWEVCYGSLCVTVLEEALDIVGLGEPVADVLGFEIDGGSTDCAGQKGFSVATTELAPGVEVDIYNHHADAGSHGRDLEARAYNFDQLADFILQFSEGRAVILGGDTNLKFESDRRPLQQEMDGGTWERFQERTGLTDVCAALDCGDQDELRAEGFKNHDRFAFRSGGGVELTPLTHAFEREKFSRDDGEPLSDHDPVAVTFRWEAAAGGTSAVVGSGEEATVMAATVGRPVLPVTGGMGHAGTMGVALVAAAFVGWTALRRVA